jgi:hypothetical protein
VLFCADIFISPLAGISARLHRFCRTPYFGMDLRIFAATKRQSSESNKNRRIDETFKKPSFSPRKFFEIRRMWHTGPELIFGCLQSRFGMP